MHEQTFAVKGPSPAAPPRPTDRVYPRKGLDALAWIQAYRTVRENVLDLLALDSATSRTATVTGRSGRLRRRMNRVGRDGSALPPLHPGLVATRRVIVAAAAAPPR